MLENFKNHGLVWATSLRYLTVSFFFEREGGGGGMIDTFLFLFCLSYLFKKKKKNTPPPSLYLCFTVLLSMYTSVYLSVSLFLSLCMSVCTSLCVYFSLSLSFFYFFKGGWVDAVVSFRINFLPLLDRYGLFISLSLNSLFLYRLLCSFAVIFLPIISPLISTTLVNKVH